MNPPTDHDDLKLVPATGVLGSGIDYTISPMLHEAADTVSGRMSDYNIFDFPPGGLDDFLQRMIEFGEIVGFNVTTPYKEVLYQRIETVHEGAREVGAVNTVKIDNGCFIGFNTDRPAFAAALNAALREHEMPREGWRVVLLGAGGAARAIIHALLDLKIAEEIIIINRSEDRKVFLLLALEKYCEEHGVKLIQHEWAVWNGVVEGLSENQNLMLINATNLGTADKSGRIRSDSLVPPHDILSRFSYVFDLVYSPPETRLVKAALQAGVAAVGGGGMLIEQAVLSRAIWFGEEHMENERAAMVAAYTSWAKKNQLGSYGGGGGGGE